MGDVFLIVLVIVVVLMLSGAFSSSTRAGRAATTNARPARGPRRAQAVMPSARAAMQRAGYAGGDTYAQVTDIGLLAYRESDEPRLVRQNAVATDTDYLRPFASLWVPYAARGMVRFEIVDNESRLRYADEARYDLAPGENTLLPGTWLPLRGKAIVPEPWQMRVSVGETVLANHVFGWQPLGGGALQRYLEHDGEISPELQQVLRAQGSQALSLSDLLGDQE